MELKGDVTRQRRLEAIDKLLSVLTLIVGAVFGLQALGLDGGWLQAASALPRNAARHAGMHKACAAEPHAHPSLRPPHVPPSMPAHPAPALQ